MFPRLHGIAFKLWAPHTKNEHWGTKDPALAYKKLAEILQEWTCRVHDRGLPRIRFNFFKESYILIIHFESFNTKIENFSKWSNCTKS